MVLNLFFYAILFIFSLLVLLGSVFFFKNRVGYRLPPSPMCLSIIGHMHFIDSVPYRFFHKLAIRYGPLIHLRLGSVPCIVVSSPEFAKECLMINELTFGSRPVTISIDYLTYNSAGFAFAHFGTVWSFMKKVLMSELLGGQALKKHCHIRNNEIQNLVQLLLKKSVNGERVNVSEELMKLSNNIITQMMLSMKYSASKEKGEEVRSLVREVTKIFNQFNVSDFFGFLRNLDLQGFLRKSTDIKGRYDILLERIIKEREEVRNKKKGKPTSDVGNNKVKDFLDILLDVSEDMNSEVKLNRDNVKAFLLYQASRVNKDVRGQHFEFKAFGTGRRGCPGIWLSLLEGPAVLAAIIQCLDWEVISSNGSKVIDMTDRPGLTVPMANPILLDLRTRFDPFNLDM
ncbi:hypothetical protein MKW98_029052 [Papaver atlanticum]|uniref:Cytochrome P450 n=1 Tax=Papaver atlanticum TaxID=357466 RepID=A0AAD4RZC5_9MAGN|nr:hypothetical protein MKW98_029052 [Papaver atlanticum]